MSITIAPIEQYSAQWSEVNSLTSQTSVATSGTGVTLSPTDVWLADADAIAQQVQTGNEVLLGELLPDLTLNLVDNTEVTNANIIAVSSGSFSLGDTTSSIFSAGDAAIEQGDLNFSLNVNGSTSGNTVFGFGSSETSSADSGLNLESPLITSISTITGTSSSSVGAAIPGITESSSSAVPVDGSTSNSSTEFSSAAVPLEFSPEAGLLLIVIVLFVRQFRWHRSKQDLTAGSVAK